MNIERILTCRMQIPWGDDDWLREESSVADYISNIDNSQGKRRGPCDIVIDFCDIVIFVIDHKRELYYGLIRIHVLLHADHEPIFGLEMMEELAHHGYRIGPGTLYPLLHGMESSGLLKSASENVQGRRRRVYRITPAGRRALNRARLKVDELYRELHEEHPQMKLRRGRHADGETGES